MGPGLSGSDTGGASDFSIASDFDGNGAGADFRSMRSMRSRFIVRHLAVALFAAAAVATGGVLGGAATPALAASPATSTFDLSNDHISHFHAQLRFVNANQFVLSSVTLTHLACDHRTAYADVFDQNGQMYAYHNSRGSTTCRPGCATAVPVCSTGAARPHGVSRHSNPF